MNLNELRDKAFAIATAKGFHDKEYSNEHWLMLVITELSEAVEADRKNKYFDELNDIDNYVRACLIDEKKAFEDYIKGTVEEELADAVIRLLDLAGLRGVDFSEIFPFEYSVESDDKIKEMSFTEWAFRNISVMVGYGKTIPFAYIIVGILYDIFQKAHVMGIDILWHIEKKMKYNELREPLHGKKY